MTGGPPEEPGPEEALRGSVVWVDAQLPPSLAHWLTSEYAVDAKHVEDIGLLHHDDPEIVDSAGSVGQPVVLITKDADFVDLLQRRGPPPVVVWVRTGNITNRELRRIVLAAWGKTAALIPQASHWWRFDATLQGPHNKELLLRGLPARFSL